MIDLLDRKAVFLDDIEHVVLDEADRMADMGFLPQVEWILRHTNRKHQTLLFSATLDGAVKVLVDRYQHDPVFHEVASTTVTVEEMIHRFVLVHELDKPKVAAAICQSAHRTILFTRTKRTADRLAHALRKEGVEAAAIHGDLPQRVREQSLDGLRRRHGAGARRHRRRRPRARHRGRRDRHALRPARGPQGVPAPLRAARRGPARPASPSRCCCGTRSWSSSGS